MKNTLWAICAICLLTLHVQGEWGRVSPEDARANSAAIFSGERILSSYLVGDQTVWILTNALNQDGTRSSSCILLPSEY